MKTSGISIGAGPTEHFYVIVLNQLSFARHTVYAKMVLAPLGVAALIYWASQERSLQIGSSAALLILGVTIALLSVVPFSWRLRQVLKVIGLEISSTDSIRVITQSMFYYFFIPLSVGTEISKFAKLKALAPNQPARAIAAAIVFDHIVGLLVLILTSIVLYVSIRPLDIELDMLAAGLLATAVAAVVAYRLIGKRAKSTADLGIIWSNLDNHKRNVLFAITLSFVMHLMIAAAVYLGALSWQIDIGYLEILFVLTGAFLFQMIPFNIVGVSALEVAGAGLYLAVGLSSADALILVSLLYCYRISIALVGGSWEFVGSSFSGHGKAPRRGNNTAA